MNHTILAVAAAILTVWPGRPAPRRPVPGPQARAARSADLRPQLEKWGLGPRSQGGRPTCSVFTAAAAIEFAVSRHCRRGTPLSVEFLNWAANDATGDPGDGGFFHDLLKGFERHGICLESEMTYRREFDPLLRPQDGAMKTATEIRSLGIRIHWINPWKPKQGLSEGHMRKIKAVLDRGYPVAAGSDHSRLLVGYVEDSTQPGGGLFVTKDSGSGRYESVTFEFARTKIGDVFWVESPTDRGGSRRPEGAIFP